MQDSLAAIQRMQTEHGQILQSITDSLVAAERLVSIDVSPSGGEPDTHKVREFEDFVTSIQKDLSEHVRFEEQEVLPVITSYAAQIIKGGLLFEHEAIRRAIAELSERTKDLAGLASDYSALTVREAEIEEKLQDIRLMIEEHSNKQEVIFDLAQMASEMEDRS